MLPKKSKAPAKRWDSLTPVEQDQLRKQYRREALSEHQLARQGAMFRCVCGQCYLSSRSQRDADGYHAMHLAEVARRIDNPQHETEYQ